MSYQPPSSSSQMTSSEDPVGLQQILSRYETEEDEFLREIESMQQCTNTDTSDDLQEESPVLGTLCSLVGEIGQLRRENRKLRRRLVQSKPHTTAPAKAPRNAAAAMVNRVGALLDSRYLPKFIGGSNSLGTSASKRYAEVRIGARERLSSPPQRETLTVSSISTDMSSDSVSLSNRHRKAPPLVLPEMFDSDAEQPIFQEVTLPPYEAGGEPDDTSLSPCRPRRTMARRSQFSSMSDHTSPSTTSMSGSSAEPSDTMTSSRSSFLEFIGLRRRRDNDSSSSSTTKDMPSSSKAVLKKRKRKISESESITSSVLHSVVPKSEKRLSAVLARDDPTAKDAAGQLSAAGSDSWLTTANNEPPGQPNKQTSKSLKSFISGRQTPDVGHRTHNDSGVTAGKKSRPKSVAYLDPGDIITKPSLKTKTKSCKSVSSRGTSASEDTNRSTYTIEEDVHCLRDENSLLRTEIQVLKTRNNRLIDQLREKSMQMSKLQVRAAQMDSELKEINKRECFKEAVENVCLRERLARGTRDIDTVEEKLRQYEAEIQNIKAETLKIQKAGLNATAREKSAYQTALEQVEKLQRDNFSLLQMQSSDLASQDKFIRQRLDIMPSYDALYSFTMGIVRKLSQMRAMLIDKSAQHNKAELEVMQVQTSLLLAHAQMEKLRHEVHILKNRRNKRPASYHGEDLIDHLAKPHLTFLLPFKLHGGRVDKHRKSQQSSAIDNLVEANEQNIEIEFLRLFDYARCLSKAFGEEQQKPVNEPKPPMRTSETVIVYRNGRGTVSPMNSPVFVERRAMMDSMKSAKSVDKSREKGRAQRRPTSWVEVNDHGPVGNGRKLTDGIYQRDGSINLPSLRNISALSRVGNQQSVVSSLQDVSSSSALRSPSTTPILTRRIPLLGSPTQMKERRLVKQSSLQYPPTTSSPYDNHPLYDCPPRSNTGTVSSSDYGTINSGRMQPQVQSVACVAANFKRQSSLEKRTQKGYTRPAEKVANVYESKGRPTPSAPPATVVYQSKLPQLSHSTHAAPLSSVPSQRRAMLRRNNSPVLEVTPTNSSPLFSRHARQSMERSVITRTSASESPSFAVRFYHPIREEEEHPSSISEATEPTTSSATLTAGTSCATATITSTVSVIPNAGCVGNSRLPQPTSRQERAAKKAGMSWLNRLRITNRKGTCRPAGHRSGQQVLGPGADAAGRLFEAARKAGAEQLNPDEAAEAMGSSSRGASQVQGGVYRLGGHGMASESLSTGGASREQPNAPVRIRMNVWENGFSLDDGPLRAFDDPQSRPFSMAVAARRIPPELVQQYPGRQVDIHMERRSSPYVAPKPKPFSGGGYRLGSPSPTVVAAAAPAVPEPSQEDQEKLLKDAQEGVKLKGGEPTTRLQIRLPNGHRLTANFNHTHTVTDVRTFAVTAVPSLEFQPFQLMTTFPNKVIENEQESLTDAGLLNAVVVVKPQL